MKLGTEQSLFYAKTKTALPAIDICQYCLKANLAKMLTIICIKDIKLILLIFFKIAIQKPFENLFRARVCFIALATFP